MTQIFFYQLDGMTLYRYNLCNISDTAYTKVIKRANPIHLSYVNVHVHSSIN